MNGQIIDQITKKPLQAVNIYASNATGQQTTTKGTTSDADGRFVVDFQSDYVTFSHIGYKSLTISNRSGFVFIELLPTAYDLPGVDIKPVTAKMPYLLLLLGAWGLYQYQKK